jgi:hypothetical protein
MQIHELRLQRSGYRPVVRTVTVQDGRTEIVSVTLERESGGQGDGGGTRIVPWIEMSSGAVAAIGGAHASFTATSNPVGPQDDGRLSPVASVDDAMGANALGAAGPARSVRSGPTRSVRSGSCVAGWTTRS